MLVHATPHHISRYALSLLEATGICVVPASGFGQAKGRVGFRTTFLPSEEKLTVAVSKFAEHHAVRIRTPTHHSMHFDAQHALSCTTTHGSTRAGGFVT